VKDDLRTELHKARTLLANEQRVNAGLLKRVNKYQSYSAQHTTTIVKLTQRVNTLQRLLEAACAARRQKTKEIMDLEQRFQNLRTYLKVTENRWITVCDKKRLLKHEVETIQRKYRLLQANSQITEKLFRNLTCKSNSDTIKISMLERKITAITKHEDKLTRHFADKLVEVSKLRKFLILEQRDKWKAEKQLLSYRDEIFAECMECFTTFLTNSCEIVPQETQEQCTTVSLFFPRMTYLDCLIAFYSKSLSTIAGQTVLNDYGQYCGFVINYHHHQQRLSRYLHSTPLYARLFRNLDVT